MGLGTIRKCLLLADPKGRPVLLASAALDTVPSHWFLRRPGGGSPASRSGNKSSVTTASAAACLHSLVRASLGASSHSSPPSPPFQTGNGCPQGPGPVPPLLLSRLPGGLALLPDVWRCPPSAVCTTWPQAGLWPPAGPLVTAWAWCPASSPGGQGGDRLLAFYWVWPRPTTTCPLPRGPRAAMCHHRGPYKWETGQCDRGSAEAAGCAGEAGKVKNQTLLSSCWGATHPHLVSPGAVGAAPWTWGQRRPACTDECGSWSQ